METLVLNAAYQPVSRVSWQTAIRLWSLEKVEIIEEYCDKWVRSPSVRLKMPAVIRLVKSLFYQKPKPKFCRKSVFFRDNGICQYCINKIKFKDSTLDHVIPKSKGGLKIWENIVLSCKKCNLRKKNRTPKEANMKLLNKPKKPLNWIDNVPELWNNWLCK